MRHARCTAFAKRHLRPIVVAVALVFPAGSGCEKTAGLPRSCSASGMAPGLTALGGAASQSIWQLALKNTSHSACFLEGFLDVHAQDEDHRNIAPADPVRPEEQRLIRVRPGMTVYSRISFAYSQPDTGQLCKDVASWLRVGLPGDKSTLDVGIAPPPGPNRDSTTFAICGGFTVGPIKTEPVTS